MSKSWLCFLEMSGVDTPIIVVPVLLVLHRMYSIKIHSTIHSLNRHILCIQSSLHLSKNACLAFPPVYFPPSFCTRCAFWHTFHPWQVLLRKPTLTPPKRVFSPLTFAPGSTHRKTPFPGGRKPASQVESCQTCIYLVAVVTPTHEWTKICESQQWESFFPRDRGENIFFWNHHLVINHNWYFAKGGNSKMLLNWLTMLGNTLRNSWLSSKMTKWKGHL